MEKKRTVLRWVQHLMLAVCVVAALVSMAAFRVHITSFGRSFYYSFDQKDQRQDAFADTHLYSVLWGNVLSDVVREGVVASQMETNGEFDGRKEIDVTAYNYRTGGLPQEYVTAKYYLSDLLRWAEHGFEWKTVARSEVPEFLADTTQVTVVETGGSHYDTTDIGYLKSDMASCTQIQERANIQDVSGNMLAPLSGGYYGSVPEEIAASEESGEPQVMLLLNRYQTAEKKNLEEYVSDWQLYNDLCQNLQNAAFGLSYNYEEYTSFNEYYNEENSNVSYMIVKPIGDDTQVITNIPAGEWRDSLFHGMLSGSVKEAAGKKSEDYYLYYDPSDMVFDTNTQLDEDLIRQEFYSYDYGYPESVKMWISVSGALERPDEFRQGFDAFQKNAEYLWISVPTAFLAGLLYLLLLIYLTWTAGRTVDEQGVRTIRLGAFDRIPTEGALLIAAGVIAVGALFLILVEEMLPSTWALFDPLSTAEWINSRPGLLLAAVLLCAADAVAMLFYYSLVRRIKARTLWRNSWCCRGVRCLGKFFLKLYDNSSVILQTWGLFLLFVLINTLGAVLLVSGNAGIVTLLLLAALDIGAGNLLYRGAKERREIRKDIERIAAGDLTCQVDTHRMHGDNLALANAVNNIGQGIKEAVDVSVRDERMKTDLITNVSHDIKTPLTSIINYVDLIKREQVENPKVQSYIHVLDEKSQRLKQLTDDLVEASKISSGNISLIFENINLAELMNQTLGEFSEKFEQKDLTMVLNINVQDAVIRADSRRIWRVIENLFNNIYKYAMKGTRVYLSIDPSARREGWLTLTLKNISEMPLNCAPEELTERFIRGDESRTTEGSGLGLSIAKNLTEAQNGTFEIGLDGDLFKVTLSFPPVAEPKPQQHDEASGTTEEK